MIFKTRCNCSNMVLSISYHITQILFQARALDCAGWAYDASLGSLIANGLVPQALAVCLARHEHVVFLFFLKKNICMCNGIPGSISISPEVDPCHVKSFCDPKKQLYIGSRGWRDLPTLVNIITQIHISCFPKASMVFGGVFSFLFACYRETLALALLKNYPTNLHHIFRNDRICCRIWEFKIVLVPSYKKFMKNLFTNSFI